MSEQDAGEQPVQDVEEAEQLDVAEDVQPEDVEDGVEGEEPEVAVEDAEVAAVESEVAAGDAEVAAGEAEVAAGEAEVAAGEAEVAAAEEAADPIEALAGVVEALLFLSPDPLSTGELADAAEADEQSLAAAIELLRERLAPGQRGLRLRELAGGYVLASDPAAESAARRLFSRPRLATLTPAQAETLAIVAYMQPVSRPEIGRIRGVSADSAAATLLERGLIEESGRSQFGAALYRTTSLFLKLFGMGSLKELPDVSQWDPSPEEQADLRDRLLRAGDARSGGSPTAGE
ncbi:MAG TPA: SMC-Scp complex subunit ScpB [Solirubrobacteraceae bacterium]